MGYHNRSYDHRMPHPKVNQHPQRNRQPQPGHGKAQPGRGKARGASNRTSPAWFIIFVAGLLALAAAALLQ